MSLEQTDAESAEHATHPRVTLEYIEADIAYTLYGTAEDLLVCEVGPAGNEQSAINLSILTICVVVMKNGFMVTGTSAPASPENFNAEYGKKLAYEDAIRQLWRLEGYALRNELATRR